jgi:hypothetical protein
MSAIPPKADIDEVGRDVRFVPKADIHRLIRSQIVSAAGEDQWNGDAERA